MCYTRIEFVKGRGKRDKKRKPPLPLQTGSSQIKSFYRLDTGYIPLIDGDGCTSAVMDRVNQIKLVMS